MSRRKKEFEIEIIEEIRRVEIVEAETYKEAKAIVMERYYENEIILDWSDFKGVGFGK